MKNSRMSTGSSRWMVSDVALDRLGRVGGEAQDVAGLGQHPRDRQACSMVAVLVDVVLVLPGRGQVLGVDALHAR